MVSIRLACDSSTNTGNENKSCFRIVREIFWIEVNKHRWGTQNELFFSFSYVQLGTFLCASHFIPLSSPRLFLWSEISIQRERESCAMCTYKAKSFVYMRKFFHWNLSHFRYEMRMLKVEMRKCKKFFHVKFDFWLYARENVSGLSNFTPFKLHNFILKFFAACNPWWIRLIYAMSCFVLRSCCNIFENFDRIQLYAYRWRPTRMLWILSKIYVQQRETMKKKKTFFACAFHYEHARNFALLVRLFFCRCWHQFCSHFCLHHRLRGKIKIQFQSSSSPKIDNIFLHIRICV